MKNSIFFLFLLTSLVFTSCSSDPASSAKKLLAEDIIKKSNGALKLKDFTKINGTKGNMMGVEVYEIEYIATMEVIQGGGYIAQCLDSDLVCGYIVYTNYGPFAARQLKKGEILTQCKTRLTLEKTDNGWVLEPTQ